MSDSEFEVKNDIFNLLTKERKLFLFQEIDGNLATSMAANLIFLDHQDSSKEIVIYINSVGGSVSNGLLTIYDTLQFIKSPVSTICIGEAYSAAAIILAAGTKGKRFASPNSKMMIHSIQIDFAISGSQQEIQDEAKRLRKENQNLMYILSKHTGQSLRKIKRDCTKDKYFSPQEAIKYGLIDGIVNSVKA